MKLEGNKFYVLDGGDEKWIFINKEEAIEQMKTIVKAGTGDNSKLLSVNTTEDQWEIKQVPWQEIAIDLIKNS